MAEHRVLGGRYEVGEPLGRGGMAEVRSGVDLRLGRPVAVKLLNGQLAANPVFRIRFRREALSAASLSHPCIVAVFDSGEEDDPVTGVSLPYIVMELVEGRTLRELLASDQQLAPERALEVTRDVLDALSHSHESGIVHRDIKPANVMLTAAGEVKVMDFGIARAVSDTSSELTLTAAVIGTAQYLSPEQARGESVDQRSDVYSTGCLLYEMLAGRPPFVGDTALSLVYQHVREVPSPPSRYNPMVTPELGAVALKALAKDPTDRYQSARKMREDIDRVLSGRQPEAALPPSLPSAEASSGVLASQAGPDPAGAPVASSGSTPESAAGAAVGSTVESEASPVRRRTTAALLVAALVLLAVTAGGYGIYLALGAGPAAAGMVSVPDVVGSTRTEAEETLRRAQLTPRVQQVSGKVDRTVNTVISQAPGSGEDVQADSVITVDVNVGVPTAAVPVGLVGQDAATAVKKLTDAGFTNVRTERSGSAVPASTKARVVAVDPAEGTSVALGQRITLAVANGDDVLLAPPSTTTQGTTGPSPGETLRPGQPDPGQSQVPGGSPPPNTSQQPSVPGSPTSSTPPSGPAQPDPSRPDPQPAEPGPARSQPARSQPARCQPARSRPARPQPDRGESEGPEPSATEGESSEPVETPEPTESTDPEGSVPPESSEPAESSKPGAAPGGSRSTASAWAKTSIATTPATTSAPDSPPSLPDEGDLP